MISITQILRIFSVMGAIAALSFIAFSASPVLAAKDNNSKAPVVRKMAETITGGYYENGKTVEMPKKGFQLGIPPNTITGEGKTEVVLKRKSANRFNMEGEKLRSRIFEYKMDAKGDAVVDGPLWLSVKLRAKKKKKHFVLKRYDKESGDWEEIDSKKGENNKTVRATVTEDSMVVAAFRKKKEKVVVAEVVEYAGKASWYNWHGSAMNEFPYGTVVVVTNPDNGKSVETTIVSSGPFVPGRVIDLPADIFSQLAPLSQGVMKVVVHKK